MPTREAIEAVLRQGTAARRAEHFDEARRFMSEALEMCGPGQDVERAGVLRELGELARNTHDLSAAQQHYEQAVGLLRPAGDPLRLAHAIRHLGDVHVGRQQWAAAEPCFIEALELYREHPAADTLDLANAIRAYAVFKLKSGQCEGAKALWTEAGELYESVGIEAGVTECRRQAEQAV